MTVRQPHEIITALVTCAQLHTGAGAQQPLPSWATKANGDPDYERIAEAGAALWRYTKNPPSRVMNQAEQMTIRNIIRRFKSPNAGCSPGFDLDKLVKQANAVGIECVSRCYLDTWVIPALQLILPGPDRDPKLARELSGP